MPWGSQHLLQKFVLSQAGYTLASILGKRCRQVRPGCAQGSVHSASGQAIWLGKEVCVCARALRAGGLVSAAIRVVPQKTHEAYLRTRTSPALKPEVGDHSPRLHRGPEIKCLLVGETQACRGASSAPHLHPGALETPPGVGRMKGAAFPRVSDSVWEGASSQREHLSRSPIRASCIQKAHPLFPGPGHGEGLRGACRGRTYGGLVTGGRGRPGRGGF